MKKPTTPKSKIRHALRLLWMRSRERGEALRNTGYCCSVCGKKQSKAKGRECSLDVHHLSGVGNWDRIFRVIYEELLVTPDKLAPLCGLCHDEIHKKEKQDEVD